MNGALADTPPPRATRSPIPRALDALYLASVWVAGVAILLMSLIIPWGVFTRYVLGSGSAWPEPIAILLMMVFTFIGAAAAYRAGSHIAVTLLTDAFPAPLRIAAGWLSDLLMLLVSAFIVWYGSALCVATWGQSISELPWLPVGATYLPLPIGGVLTLVFVLERMVFGSQAGRPIVRYDAVRAAAESVD
ncbi:MAG: TRAP transporter small permease [Pseudomonadota bacterium]|nr:TRAP transporter small permease [Pseudomonadota bacterium]